MAQANTQHHTSHRGAVLTSSLIVALALAAIAKTAGPNVLAKIKAWDQEAALPPSPPAAVVTPAIPYDKLFRENGALIFKVSNKPNVTEAVGAVQDAISPGARHLAQDTISLSEDRGYTLSPNSRGSNLKGITYANDSGNGVIFAIARPIDADVLARLEKSFRPVEILPTQLSTERLDVGAHLANLGLQDIKPEQVKLNTARNGVTVLKVSGLKTEPSSPNVDVSYHDHRKESSFERCLSQLAGVTTFPGSVAVAGTHTTIAKAICGSNSPYDEALGKHLETEAPKIIKGVGFACPVPAFLNLHKKGDGEIVMFFGSREEAVSIVGRLF